MIKIVKMIRFLGLNGRRVQRVQKVHRVQRGRCPAPAGLAVMAPKGETTHYILRVASAPSKCVRCAPPAAAGCIERLCSLPLRGKVAAPPQFIAPFPREGGGTVGDGGTASVLFKIFRCSSALSGSSIPVGQAKGRPFYGQAEGQLCPTWQCYAGLPPEEGAWPFITCRSAAAPFPLPPFQLKNGAPKRAPHHH